MQLSTKLLATTILLAFTLSGCDDDSHDHDHGADAGVHHTHDAGPSGTDAGLVAIDSGSAGGDAGATAGMRDVVFRFRARVGDRPVDCTSTFSGLGADGTQSVSFLDFRFYVHDFELLRSDGSSVPVTLPNDGTWQRDGVAMLDFEDRAGTCINGTTEVRTEVHGRAPVGAYAGVRFKLGVPFALNHQDVSTAAPPLDLSSLFWNWQGGYKFARIDTQVASAPAPAPVFNVHLGSTGCDGTPAGAVTTCAQPNRPTITLMGFDVDASVVIADYAQLVEGLDLTANTPASPPGCMSGPTDAECDEVFASVGLAHGAASAAQDFFRVGTP